MTKLHPKAVYLFWWSYFWIFLFTFAFLGFFVGIWILAITESLSSLFWCGIIILVLSGVLSALWAKLMYNSYSFETTKTALNIKWGVLRKHSATIPYQRIQNIDVNRGIMARLLGISEVWIQTAGFSAALSKFGAMRFSEGMVPGLDVKEAEKLRALLLKKTKGRQGL
ncbi:MAG: PH domain-containing protein [Candidatus Aenigmarchaeota archaeon]|nr:PH domain-containing protein [Candidatus Aenigmarchaeota archaeon]